MPSLQATADDALPRGDSHAGTTINGGEEEEERQLQSPSSPASSDAARALLACSPASWPLSLRRLSFSTELLALPVDVAEWMRSGGRVWLPEGSAAIPVRAEMDEFDVAEEQERFGEAKEEEEAEAERGEGEDDDNDSDTSSPPPGLAEFSRSIDVAIARLGGRAFPKLDWSAPLDAAWLRPGGSLECSNADEVLLLLKSSDRISHDLEELSRVTEAISKGDDSSIDLLQNISSPTLALRKWHALRPAAEFRAFLDVGFQLVAVCQRDVTQHFEGLERDRRTVLRSVARFVRRELAPALLVAARPASSDASSSVPSPSILASSRLVADLYVHSSSATGGGGKVRLVDLAVPGGATSPLLFSSWDEVFSEEKRGGGEERQQQASEEEEIEDASDAELSLPSSSSEDVEEEEDDGYTDEISESGTAEQQQQKTLPPYERPRRVVRFRVVGGAASRGRIAPGRSLYGAPHDFADGECVEALVERLRATGTEG